MAKNTQAASDLMDSAMNRNEVERLQGELAECISHNGELEWVAANALDGKMYRLLDVNTRKLAEELMRRGRMMLHGSGNLYRV